MTKIPLNKADLIEHIAEQADISKAAAAKALQAVLEGVTAAMCSGKSVSLLGFGTFTPKTRAARVGRNPKTGEPIQIAAANVVIFKTGKALKDAVNSETIPEQSGA